MSLIVVFWYARTRIVVRGILQHRGRRIRPKNRWPAPQLLPLGGRHLAPWAVSSSRMEKDQLWRRRRGLNGQLLGKQVLEKIDFLYPKHSMYDLFTYIWCGPIT